MSWDDRLPKDWRTFLAIVVLTLGGLYASEKWVISIARAQDEAQRQAIDEMRPMVKEVYLACVRRGECDGKAVPP